MNLKAYSAADGQTCKVNVRLITPSYVTPCHLAPLNVYSALENNSALFDPSRFALTELLYGTHIGIVPLDTKAYNIFDMTNYVVYSTFLEDISFT